MMRYLLDTNVIADAVRNPGGAVDGALRQHRNDEIGISIIVSGEILFGLKRNANVKGRQRLDALLQALSVWGLEDPVGDFYGDVRASMEKRGQSMGANDLWIAAHSLALDATLVTNDAAFSMVPGLKIENWLHA